MAPRCAFVVALLLLIAGLGCSSTVTAGGAGGAAVSDGGSAGTASISCAQTAPTSGSSPVIDDFEDGDGRIQDAGGRTGTWYGQTDETAGVFTPATLDPLLPQASDISSYAMHVTASGFTSWGAAFGCHLNTGACTYDASSFTGIALKLKGTGTVRLELVMAGTMPVAYGGSCTADCFNHYFVDVLVPAEWTTLTFQWGEFGQLPGYGAVPFTSGELMDVEFHISVGESMDVWLDDLSFIR